MTPPSSPSRPKGAYRDRFIRCARWCVAVGVPLGLLAVIALVEMRAARGTGRSVAQDVRFPLSPPSASPWTTEDAFGALRFFEPTAVVHAGEDRYFVLERRGTLQHVWQHDGAWTRRTLLDVESRVIRTPYDDDGALGIALHPDFGRAGTAGEGHLFLFYTARAGEACYDRLSRFTVAASDADGGISVDPASELILIDQLDDDLWHNGGALAFGPDGFLYVGVGDEGGEADALGNAQRIDRDLFSGILRIDVDRRGPGVSHPPPRQPETGRTAHYFIPDDNPFVGRPGALEEFWSIGLRNPHRIAFDPATGRLWVGDVGQIRREEVNLATRGSNHQWSYAEGRMPFKTSPLEGTPPDPLLGVDTPPVHDYPHLSGNTCVIGGEVYRGTRHPELEGKYVYADNGSGRIWALEYDGREKVSNVELMSLPVSSKTGISSLGVDADGEILIVVLGAADRVAGRIHRLVPAPPGSGSSLPGLLSETGLFTDLEKLTPAAGVVPYVVNTLLWSDGAHKRRWIMLPGDGTDPDPATDRIGFTAKGDWHFPPGTVLVKHFDLPVDESRPEQLRRLETRVVVVQADGGVYGTTYKWNDEGSDAVLLAGGVTETLSIRTADGGTRRQEWHYPSRASCLVCHTEKAGYVLGVSTRQLAGNLADPKHGVPPRQLRRWSRTAMFREPVTDDALAAAPRLTPIDDQSASLEHRVRSYLDANCASCHRPGGARANFDARFETPLDLQGLVGGHVNTQDGLSGARIVSPGDAGTSMLLQRMLHRSKPMPPLGVARRNARAIALLTEWIGSLPAPPGATPTDVPPSPVATDDAPVAADDAPVAADDAPAAADDAPLTGVKRVRDADSAGDVESVRDTGPDDRVSSRSAAAKWHGADAMLPKRNVGPSSREAVRSLQRVPVAANMGLRASAASRVAALERELHATKASNAARRIPSEPRVIHRGPLARSNDA